MTKSAKLTRYRTSAAQYDGAMPLIVQSDAITITTTSQVGVNTLVPFDGDIVGIAIKVTANAPSATGEANVINIGTEDDPDKFVQDLNLADLGVATGFYEVPLTTGFGVVDTEVDIGDVIEFSSEAVATGVDASPATFYAALIIVPRGQGN